MRLIVLGSGSKGNATLIDTGRACLLIDNGFSAKELLARLRAVGVDPARIRALLLTHEHNDHAGGVGVLARRLNIPVHANVDTLRRAEAKLGVLPEIREFNTGERFTVENVTIHAFSVSHDTADPVGFTVSDGRHCLGYCTDTGTVTRLTRHCLAACEALVLEANHDVDMLRHGPYPLPLQQRVLSNQGHLANSAALDLAAELAVTAGGRLRRVIFAHLSEVNNSPEVLLRDIAARGDQLAGLEIRLAQQHGPSAWLCLDAGDTV